MGRKVVAPLLPEIYLAFEKFIINYVNKKLIELEKILCAPRGPGVFGRRTLVRPTARSSRISQHLNQIPYHF